MRILALDYGTRRIGCAITDPTGVLAQPLETIARRGASLEPPLARIAELIAEYAVERIVVGLPLHMNGRAGPEADAARRFGDQVAERTGVPVEYLDERWTTREAERVLREAGVRRGRRRTDPIAAALILRTWLERRVP